MSSNGISAVLQEVTSQDCFLPGYSNLLETILIVSTVKYMNPQKNTIWLLKDRTRRAVSPFFCLYVDCSFMFTAQCLCLCTSDYVFGLSVRSRLSFSFLWPRYLKNVSREYLQIWHQCPLGLEDELSKRRWFKVRGYCDLTEQMVCH